MQVNFLPGSLIATLAVVACAAGAAAQGPAASRPAATNVEWNARAAEHLYNRAGFGARPAEIQRAVAIGHAAAVEELLRGSSEPVDPFAVEPPPRPEREAVRGMDEEQRREAFARVRAHERDQLAGFAGWWIDQMIDGRNALRERMTLFWHGTFTSSYQDVRSSVAMIEQNELLRRHALGSFGDLLRGIVRDPAMLEYLDNNQNRKESPNENFARELMELFTLGEGNYSERDVQEAARALTGWVTRRDQDARYLPRQHDPGEKEILGRTGRFDADGLVEILLDQPACPRWVAGKLLAHFEGRQPPEARLADYAAFLKSSGYDVGAFVRRLLLDPQFYSSEVREARIAGPIDYLVGTSRRLGVRPPPQLVWLGAGQLGQRLFDPPNVKGWEGGRSWITTSSVLARGNMAGMLLGVVRLQDVIAPDAALDEGSSMEDPAMSAAAESMGSGDGQERRAQQPPRRPAGGEKGKAGGGLKARAGEMGRMARLLGEGFRPNVNLAARCERAGVQADAAIVDTLCSELLPVGASAESRAALLEFLAAERGKLGATEGELLARGFEGEMALRRLAHLILSLPEAQMN